MLKKKKFITRRLYVTEVSFGYILYFFLINGLFGLKTLVFPYSGYDFYRTIVMTYGHITFNARRISLNANGSTLPNSHNLQGCRANGKFFF